MYFIALIIIYTEVIVSTQYNMYQRRYAQNAVAIAKAEESLKNNLMIYRFFQSSEIFVFNKTY